MAELRTTVTIVLKNKKAIRALRLAREIIADEAASQQWNAELQKAERALMYAITHLSVVSSSK